MGIPLVESSLRVKVDSKGRVNVKDKHNQFILLLARLKLLRLFMK